MSDSDSDDENIIKYGTPLEPYEEDEVPTKRKYQQQTDQFAVDAHGRRRFHGAFTGGFSAGFGNTVGTPEGWTPSTFKSSRSEKAPVSGQRPEDFMDEEDRGEFGIAPRHMQTHSEFSGQKRQRQQRYHDGPIPGEPVLEQLVHAVHETAAVRILRGMGWRPGQGAGERLHRHQKARAREQHRVYGCYMPPELRQNTEETQDSDDSSTSEYDVETLFAPDDYEPYILHRKNDRFGLGYSGLSRHSVLGTMAGEYGGEAGGVKSHLVMKDKGRKVSIRGQAFGVGAFEADDDDIYATEDMSHYDFTIAPPAQPQQKITSKKSGSVLEGFVKSSKPTPTVPSYPPPALPRDYTPAAGGRRTRFAPTAAAPRDQGLGRHELTANARGALLGETPIPLTTTQAPTATDSPPQPNTAADIPPQADPVTKVLGRSITFEPDNKTLDYIPIKDSGKKLTKVFKPFVGNPQKQARYERYLEDKGGGLERDGDTGRLSEWERERELMEFEQAAKLYRPLTGVMGDRFTHAAQPDEGAVNPLCAVAKSSTTRGGATLEQVQAAEKGLYGVMTRREAPWRPEGLLCKRFNVPDPGGPRIEQKKEDKPKVSYSVFSYLESSVHDKDSFAKEQSKFSGSKSLNRETSTENNQVSTKGDQISAKTDQMSTKTDQTSTKSDQISAKTDQMSTKSDQSSAKTGQTSTKSGQDAKMCNINAGFNKRMTVAELFMKESEKHKDHGNEVTETINQFDKMDLYKAIFLSDSEDEADIISKNYDAKDFIDVPTNLERNTSPPRGIFANIDFDELNSWKRIDKPETSKKLAEKVDDVAKSTENNKNSSSNQEEEVYGPKIPEFLQKRLETEVDKVQSIEIKSSSSEDSWVDVNELKNKKKKKKIKKHKSKHKKKSKSKKKDR